MENKIGADLRRAVAERARGACEYCRVQEDDLFHGCVVDYVISVKYEGQTLLPNLAYVCFLCSRRKGGDIGSYIPTTAGFIRFFNPRTDGWGDHFRMEAGRIEALSPVGEATVRIFAFNHPDRVAFRKLLVELGRLKI